MSLLSDDAKLLNCAKAGARGYILKATDPATLVGAIREIARGRIWVDRQVSCADSFALLAHRASTIDDTGAQINVFDVLSKRELEVLSLIGRGLKNEEIGRKLFISVPTVKVHLAHTFNKLNVTNRTQAALLLMQARLRNDPSVTAPFSREARLSRIDLAVSGFNDKAGPVEP